MKLGNSFFHARKKSGLTQEEVAQKYRYRPPTDVTKNIKKSCLFPYSGQNIFEY